MAYLLYAIVKPEKF
ncbi:MAG: potassium-transporting ATPase subunit F [Planctomycetota bacterium]